MDTVLELMQDAVARYDRKPFLLIRPGFRTRITRYRDLGRIVPRVARVLHDRGLRKGGPRHHVGRQPAGVGITLLGAIHAGVVLVPLDVQRARLRGQGRGQDQSQPRLRLTSRPPPRPRMGLPVVLIERIPDLARTAEPLPAADIGPDDLVEVLFTSGTTGEPKGAMLTHPATRGFECAGAAQGLPHRSERANALGPAPVAHLRAVPRVPGPHARGASVVYPVSRQPSVLLRTFRDFKVSILLIVPQGLKLLDNAIERKVDQGGKRATFEKLHRWAENAPRFMRRLLFRPVLSSFGGRLHTVGIGPVCPGPGPRQPLGGDGDQRPPGVRCHGARSAGRLHAQGEQPAGDGGPGGGRGGDADRRGRRGHGPQRGRVRRLLGGSRANGGGARADGWYHTGDIGEISADGFLTLRGRKKDMLAMPDGTKVYPEDIEAVLVKDERVRDATVVGFPVGPDLRIHAVLLTDDPAVPDAVIRDANDQVDAHQQIRAHSVWPDEDFPRTHTLKVKKREVIARLEADAAARSPRPHRGAAAQPPPAPGRHTLDTLIGLVAAIAELSPDAIQPAARLSSDLNMDSLHRVELLGVIEEEMGVFVDDSALDPEATVAQIAAMVDASRELKHETGVLAWPLHPVSRAVGMTLGARHRAVLNLFYRIRIRGQEHLAGLEGPSCSHRTTASTPTTRS